MDSRSSCERSPETCLLSGPCHGCTSAHSTDCPKARFAHPYHELPFPIRPLSANAFPPTPHRHMHLPTLPTQRGGQPTAREGILASSCIPVVGPCGRRRTMWNWVSGIIDERLILSIGYREFIYPVSVERHLSLGLLSGEEFSRPIAIFSAYVLGLLWRSAHQERTAWDFDHFRLHWGSGSRHFPGRWLEFCSCDLNAPLASPCGSS